MRGCGNGYLLGGLGRDRRRFFLGFLLRRCDLGLVLSLGLRQRRRLVIGVAVIVAVAAVVLGVILAIVGVKAL